jgi:predicted phage tail protein
MVAFAFGVIVAAQPSTFTPRLGIGKGYGIFLIVVGAVLVLAAWLSPVLWGTSHRAGVEHRDVMESR